METKTNKATGEEKTMDAYTTGSIMDCFAIVISGSCVWGVNALLYKIEDRRTKCILGTIWNEGTKHHSNWRVIGDSTRKTYSSKIEAVRAAVIS